MSVTFHKVDTPTEFFWWLGPRGLQVEEYDLEVEVEEPITTFAYGDGTATFVHLKNKLSYEEMLGSMNHTALGRVTLFPVRDPERAKVPVLEGVRAHIWAFYKEISRKGVLHNLKHGQDDRISAKEGPPTQPHRFKKQRREE
jgi:hypothetical protein